MSLPESVAGVDISTQAIHVATVPLDPTLNLNPRVVEVRTGPLEQHPEGGDKIVDEWRCGSAFRVALALIRPLEHVRVVAIERPGGGGPIGRQVAEYLLPILGAVNAAALEWCDQVMWLAPAEWRKKVGAVGREVNAKPGGHAAVRRCLGVEVVGRRNGLGGFEPLGGDELDALGVALACRSILWAHRQTASA